MRGALARLAVCAALAGCGARGGGEGPLLRALGDDLDVIIVATPRQIAGTWAERAATMLVPPLTPCVRARALGAEAAAAVWRQRDGAEGDWTLVLIGGGATAPGCDELERGGGLAWWGPDPRSGDHRFFASPERKRRWRSLGTAPIRVVGDLEVQAGILVHVSGTVDARDGIDARVLLRFDERAAADGFDQLRQRHAARLDRERLGGAWAVFGATLSRDPRDPAGTTLRGELRIPGRAGEEAMMFATTAYIGGDLGAPGAPCPWIPDAWQPQVSCSGAGRFVVAAALRDQLVDDPTMLARDARVVSAIHSGMPAGFKVYAVRPASLVAALGIQNGDRVHSIGAHDVKSVEEAAAVLAGLRHATHVSVELERRGQDMTLRYEIR